MGFAMVFSAVFRFGNNWFGLGTLSPIGLVCCAWELGSWFLHVVEVWSGTPRNITVSRFLWDNRIKDPRKNRMKSRKLLRLAYENEQSRDLLSQISPLCHQ
jgi:hypothetical protein